MGHIVNPLLLRVGAKDVFWEHTMAMSPFSGDRLWLRLLMSMRFLSLFFCSGWAWRFGWLIDGLSFVNIGSDNVLLVMHMYDQFLLDFRVRRVVYRNLRVVGRVGGIRLERRELVLWFRFFYASLRLWRAMGVFRVILRKFVLDVPLVFAISLVDTADVSAMFLCRFFLWRALLPKKFRVARVVSSVARFFRIHPRFGLLLEMRGRAAGQQRTLRFRKVFGAISISSIRGFVDYAQCSYSTRLGCVGVRVWYVGSRTSGVDLFEMQEWFSNCFFGTMFSSVGFVIGVNDFIASTGFRFVWKQFGFCLLKRFSGGLVQQLDRLRGLFGGLRRKRRRVRVRCFVRLGTKRWYGRYVDSRSFCFFPGCGRSGWGGLISGLFFACYLRLVCFEALGMAVLGVRVCVRRSLRRLQRMGCSWGFGGWFVRVLFGWLGFALKRLHKRTHFLGGVC